MAHAPAYSSEPRVVSLAEYRQRIYPSNTEHPPPSPCPAAARRPHPPTWIDAVARPRTPLSPSVVAA